MNENMVNETEIASVMAEATPQEQVPMDQPEIITIGTELTQDELNKVYSRLGRPESPDNYDLSDILPDGGNATVIDEFKKKAFENGMSTDGVRKMAEWYKNVEMQQAEAMQKARDMQADQHVLQLKKEFGVKFDDEIKNARKALDAYTDPDFKKYMDESGLGNHPALVKAFAKIGRELSEDRLVQSETATRMAHNDQLRQSEIMRLRADKEFMAKYRRGDANAVQRLNNLYSDN